MRFILASALAALTAQMALAAPTAETLPSGVTIERYRDGTGASPALNDVVRVHYQGTLTNGREFDSSYARGKPAEFPVNGVIPCWTEVLQRMKVGESVRISCPPKTAYGERGISGVIPPNSTLNFVVELLEIRR